MKIKPGTLPKGVRVIAVLFVAACLARVYSCVRGPDVPRFPGLPTPARPIAVAVMPPADLANRLALEQRSDHGHRSRCTRLGLLALGLVETIEPPPLFPSRSILDRIFGYEVTPAFYVTGTDTIFVSTKDHPSLAHEWIHALDDQHGTRLRDAIDPAVSLDRRIALRAAIEGTAIHLVGSQPQTLLLGNDFDVNSWTFAYSIGPRYVSVLARRDAARALRLRPESVYEVLFLAAPPVRNTDWADWPGTLLCEDELGVLALLTAMNQSGAASRDDAMRVARAWAGDRLSVRLLDGERLIFWEIALADSLAASIWRRTGKLHLSLVGSAHVTERVLGGAPELFDHPLSALRKLSSAVDSVRAK